jgi:hypothetical protein
MSNNYITQYNIWNSILEKKKNKPLIFIHTPKCGGIYVSQILDNLKIYFKGHNQAIENEGINFTVIRDPVERFESLLNYRLCRDPRGDWPQHLLYVYDDININLNEIVSKMTDDEILSFTPYKSLTYWSKNVDIFITIDQLHDFLKFFGYDYNINDYKERNVSKKLRGNLSCESRERIAKLYYDDVLLFDKIKNN